MGDMTPEQLAARWLSDVPTVCAYDNHTPPRETIWRDDALATIARHLAPCGNAQGAKAMTLRGLIEADGITPHDLFAATAPNDIPRDFMPRPLPCHLPGFRDGMGVSQQDRLAREFDAKRAVAWRWHWADAMIEHRDAILRALDDQREGGE